MYHRFKYKNGFDHASASISTEMYALQQQEHLTLH
jgi:hypothetical protein